MLANLRLAYYRFNIPIYRDSELLFFSWFNSYYLSFWWYDFNLYCCYFYDFLFISLISFCCVLVSCFDARLAWRYKLATFSSIFFLYYSIVLRYCFYFKNASYATSFDMDDILEWPRRDYFYGFSAIFSAKILV